MDKVFIKPNTTHGGPEGQEGTVYRVMAGGQYVIVDTEYCQVRVKTEDLEPLPARTGE